MAEILKDTTANTIGTGDGALVLDPSGTELVTINNGVVIPDGTEAAPSIRLSDDTNTGIFSPTNESVGIVGNGAEALRVSGVVSGVNNVEILNSVTGGDLIIRAIGDDASIDLDLQSKGSGKVRYNGGEVLTSVTASNVDSTGATDGYVLTADGAGNAAWEAASGGATTLDGLTDVSLGSPSINDVLTFDGSVWSAAAPTGGGLTEVTAGDVNSEASTDGYVLTSDGAGNAAWEALPASGASTLDELSDVNVGVGPVSARYWRLQIVRAEDSVYAYPKIQEVEFHTEVGGVDRCSGGVAQANNYQSTNYPSKAVDNSLTTAWVSNNTGISSSRWWQYDFGAGNEKAIVEYKINSDGTVGPYEWYLQYSNDNVNFTNIDYRTSQIFTTDSWKTFVCQTPDIINGEFLKFTGGVWDSSAITESDISDLQNYSLTTHVHEGTTIDATGVTDGYVLTADGAGNSVWESPGGVATMNDLNDVNIGSHLYKGRYWRFNILGVYGPNYDDFIRVVELTLKTSVGGGQAATGGTPSASTGTASYAFDGTDTAWVSVSEETGWLTYDFGIGNDVTIIEYDVRSYGDGVVAAYQSPSSWQLQVSDDNSNWTTVDSRSGITWNLENYETKTFTAQTLPGFYTGDYIRFDGSMWSGVTLNYISDITGESLGDLSDVDLTGSPTYQSGDVLTFDGSVWTYSALPTSPTYSALTVNPSSGENAQLTLKPGDNTKDAKVQFNDGDNASMMTIYYDDTNNQNRINSNKNLYINSYSGANITINPANIANVTKPFGLASYTVSGLPAGSAGQVVYCSNGDVGTPCLAVHDGSSWKVVSLGATVSAT